MRWRSSGHSSISAGKITIGRKIPHVNGISVDWLINSLTVRLSRIEAATLISELFKPASGAAAELLQIALIFNELEIDRMSRMTTPHTHPSRIPFNQFDDQPEAIHKTLDLSFGVLSFEAASPGSCRPSYKLF